MLSPDFREFVELLIKHHAEYMVVGGYAVSVHGHPRYTGDLDIWLNSTTENAKKIVQVVNDFGFGSFGLTEEDFTKPDSIVQLGYPPLRIDLLTNIDGVTFKECYENKVVIELEGLFVNFISYNDLIRNKEKSGRPLDLDDIDNLRKQGGRLKLETDAEELRIMNQIMRGQVECAKDISIH